MDEGLSLFEVCAAEEVGVVEDMVELVEREAVGVAMGERPFLFVSGIKDVRKPPEEARHGEVAFPIGDVYGGIEDDGTVVCESDITYPKVAVDEGVLRVVVFEESGNLLEELRTLFKGAAILCGEVELWGNPRIAEEGHPIGGVGIELRGIADPVILVPAEGVGGGAVELCQLFAESLPLLSGAVFEFDKFEDEAGVFLDNFAKDGLGDANGVRVLDGFEGIGLGLEKAHFCTWAIFQEERLVIVGVKGSGLVDTAAGDRLGF